MNLWKIDVSLLKKCHKTSQHLLRSSLFSSVGGFMLVVQDLATSEETDSMNLQPGQETSDSDANPGNSFLHFFFFKSLFLIIFFFLTFQFFVFGLNFGI